MRRLGAGLGLAWLAAMGCHRSSMPPGGYTTAAEDPRRDTEAARALNAEGVGRIEAGDLAKAERLFKEALTADVFHGTAHNNLGLVYYRQRRLYLAAWEFQYAVKLMPNRCEPRNNLGLVFEAVRQMDEAEKWYDEALALEPDNMETIGNLARALVRANRKDSKTRRILNEVVLKDTRPEWVAWAEERLVMLGGPVGTPGEEGDAAEK